MRAPKRATPDRGIRSGLDPALLKLYTVRVCSVVVAICELTIM